MKIKLLIIVGVLLLVNFFFVPSMTEKLRVKDYLVLNPEYISRKLSVQDYFEVHLLPTVELVNTKMRTNVNVWACYDRFTDKLLWTKEMKDREYLKVEAQKIFTIEISSYGEDDYVERNGEFARMLNLYQYYNLSRLDTQTGEVLYSKQLGNQDIEVRQISFTNSLVHVHQELIDRASKPNKGYALSSGKKGRLEQKYIMFDIDDGSKVSEITTSKYAFELEEKQDFLAWSKTVKDWSKMHFVDSSRILYDQNKNQFFDIKNWKVTKVELPLYWVVFLEKEVPPRLQIQVYSKKIPNELMWSDETIKKLEQVDYTDTTIFWADKKGQNIASEPMQRLGIWLMEEEGRGQLYLGDVATKESKRIPATTWIYRVDGDTILLHNPVSKERQKLLFPYSRYTMQDIRLQKNKWAVYTKTGRKYNKYVVPATGLPHQNSK